MLPVPLTEVKVNVLMYLIQTIAFGFIVLDDAKIALYFLGNSYAYEKVVPGMSTLVSNFSGHSLSYKKKLKVLIYAK
jgi:hypothetical protein